MSDDNLDSANLKDAQFGGMIREDVLARLFDISNYPLPWTEMMGTPDTVKNSYAEWTVDELDPVNMDNAIVDGAAAGANNARTGQRVGNHCQISGKYVYVSTRANASDTIGKSKELVHQTSQRQKELRRDVDGISQGPQASVPDDGSAVAGRSAGVQAWLVTNADGGVGRVAGGFNLATGIVDAPVPGLARALDENGLRNILQSCFEEGGNPTKAFTVPALKRKMSTYFMGPDSATAVFTQDIENAAEQATAKGAVDVWVSDFNIIELIPSRTMQPYLDTTPVTPISVASVVIVDPEYIRLGFLKGYQSELLGKKGLSDEWQITGDWTLKVLNEKAHAIFADVDPTLPMVQSPV